MTGAGPRKGQTFGNALKWSYVMDVGRQFTTLLVTFVLAGMLGPRAYGIVAIAATYIAFLQLLLAQGLQPAVIQRRDLRDEHKDTAFWMIMAAAVGLTLLTIPLSSWWADLNNTPELGPVVLALSLTLPIEGLRVVQEALMRRDLNMRPLAVRTNVSVIFGGIDSALGSVSTSTSAGPSAASASNAGRAQSAVPAPTHMASSPGRHRFWLGSAAMRRTRGASAGRRSRSRSTSSARERCAACSTDPPPSRSTPACR